MAKQPGEFYPFQCYLDDIAMSLDGLYKIYPSKYIAFNMQSKFDGTFPEGFSMGYDKNDGETEPNNYNDVRYSIYPAIDSQYKVDVNNPNAQVITMLRKEATLICSGDVNFLSHDVDRATGHTYAETYIEVNPSDVKKWVYLRGFDAEKPDLQESILNTDENRLTNPAIENNVITFNAIVVYYNVFYRGVDATIEDNAIVRDMPMGIYVLDEDQSLLVESDSLYGGGTSWALRIASRFINGQLAEDQKGLETKSSDYHTLTKVFSEFGKITEQVNRILTTKGDVLQDCKSYLDEFKNKHHVNVPYVIGDHWYVNGKDLGAITIDPELIGRLVDERMSALYGSGLERLKGDQGPRGPQGIPGKDGSKVEIKLREDGYWVWCIDGEETEYVAQPEFSIVDGYWYINGQPTTQKAQGEPGNDAPVPNIKNGTWWIGEDYDTGIAVQANPAVITIGQNGHWYIDGSDTGKIAETKVGIDPVTNHWMINGADSGVHATGPQGPQGDPGPQGEKGKDGKGIKNISVGYYICNQNTLNGLTPTWSTEPLEPTNDNRYLWIRTIITYTDGTSYTTTNIAAVRGKDPNITIESFEGKDYWVIDGVRTNVIAHIGVETGTFV